MNLVQNALDAMQKRDSARLEVAAGCTASDEPDESGSSERSERRNNGIWVTLRDTGPGIAEADMLKVMDPFFTTKPVGTGTGLGLSISDGILQDHGGESDPDCENLADHLSHFYLFCTGIEQATDVGQVLLETWPGEMLFQGNLLHRDRSSVGTAHRPRAAARAAGSMRIMT